MKLSDAMLNIIGVCYKTAWNIWKPGELNAYQLPSGTIIVKNNINSSQYKFVKVVIYCRVSIYNKLA
ncbi:MAG: hypothetical protein MGU50_18240 [Trichodesmium sp. MAG_R02]|jgi:predicted site-specific integrase-resolvase|nr:hypothetical protein [Trichodesmium sp. MAG_R02]